MRFAKNTQHDTSKVLRLLRLLKTLQKYCACHTKRLQTRYETCWNVTKCHDSHAKRSYATSEISKSDHCCRTRHRHGHTGLTRTVADGCDGCAASSEHTLNPQTPRVKREPLLRIREKGSLADSPNKTNCWIKSPLKPVRSVSIIPNRTIDKALVRFLIWWDAAANLCSITGMSEVRTGFPSPVAARPQTAEQLRVSLYRTTLLNLIWTVFRADADNSPTIVNKSKGPRVEEIKASKKTGTKNPRLPFTLKLISRGGLVTCTQVYSQSKWLSLKIRKNIVPFHLPSHDSKDIGFPPGRGFHTVQRSTSQSDTARAENVHLTRGVNPVPKPQVLKGFHCKTDNKYKII